MAAQIAVQREVGEADVETLAALEQICFPEDPWPAEMFHGFLESPAVKGMLLEEDGRVVGYMVAYEVLDEAELLNIAIVPKERGRGLGRQLLASWLDRLRAHGVVKVYLDVRQDNTPAIGLYESFGFETVGLRPRYYSNGENALEMVLVMGVSGGDEMTRGRA